MTLAPVREEFADESNAFNRKLRRRDEFPTPIYCVIKGWLSEAFWKRYDFTR